MDSPPLKISSGGPQNTLRAKRRRSLDAHQEIRSGGDLSSIRTKISKFRRALDGAREVLDRLEVLDLEVSIQFSNSNGAEDFYEIIRNVEISLIRRALFRTKGNQRRAAALLNLKHTTLNSKIKTYKINSKDAMVQWTPDAPNR